MPAGFYNTEVGGISVLQEIFDFYDLFVYWTCIAFFYRYIVFCVELQGVNCDYIIEYQNDIKKAGLVGIWGNIFLLIIKGIIGFITHSQSMIADAVNSAGDIFASLMTFIGNKIASKPGDKTHNFGHRKI